MRSTAASSMAARPAELSDMQCRYGGSQRRKYSTVYLLSLSLSDLSLQVVHTSGKFGHPANWAGYMLMGKDIVLRDRSAELAGSLRMMLQSPQDYLIATLKTLQAMVGENNYYVAKKFID